jgi:hypothetical protein
MVYCSGREIALGCRTRFRDKAMGRIFPGIASCASAGDTEEQAIQNAKEALELWFEPAPVNLSAGAKVLEVALT